MTRSALAGAAAIALAAYTSLGACSRDDQPSPQMLATSAPPPYVATSLPPPPPPPPPPIAEEAYGVDEATAAPTRPTSALPQARPPALEPGSGAPFVTTMAQPAAGAAPAAVPPPPACAPASLDCNESLPGRGAFATPPPMWVGQPADLTFAVGKTDAGIVRELAPRNQPARTVRVNIGRCMKVTLEEDSRFDILSRNGETKRLAKDMDRASWRWSVRPKLAGVTEFRAKVEVLRKDGNRCTDEALDEYTERVEVQVQIGLGSRFKGAVGEATETGGLFAALFKSWQGALVSLAALLAAVSSVIVAVRNLGPKGRERRAVRREKRAARKGARAAKPARKKKA
jgi:hypothetical protein